MTYKILKIYILKLVEHIQNVITGVKKCLYLTALYHSSQDQNTTEAMHVICESAAQTTSNNKKL